MDYYNEREIIEIFYDEEMECDQCDTEMAAHYSPMASRATTPGMDDFVDYDDYDDIILISDDDDDDDANDEALMDIDPAANIEYSIRSLSYSPVSSRSLSPISGRSYSAGSFISADATGRRYTTTPTLSTTT